MASGNIEITMPLRRVILSNNQQGWLHALWNGIAAIELDDGTMINWAVPHFQFVEPYTKVSIFEDSETKTIISLALQYKDLLLLAEEGKQYANISLQWAPLDNRKRCHRCGEHKTINDDDLCFECWEKITTIRNLIY